MPNRLSPEHIKSLKVQSPMDDLRQASAELSGIEVLSPAAQAIRQAVAAVFASSPAPPTTEDVAAAVLRAAADQAVPEAANAVGDQHDEARRDQWLRIRWKLLAIAAELEGSSDA